MLEHPFLAGEVGQILPRLAFHVADKQRSSQFVKANGDAVGQVQRRVAVVSRDVQDVVAKA
jgi:hypothetical protein